jgi:mannose-6-phosphate isomerase
MLPKFLLLQPEYRDYIWGGQRLRPGQLTAEAWVIYENDRIKGGPLSGKTLVEVTEQFGEELLGRTAVEKRGKRFPLLIKLLDCNQWLSLQVHPNDQQAVELEGAGQNGKTEAWYFLETAPDGQIIAGLKSSITREELEQAIRSGTILDYSNYLNVKAGDTVFMRAGTIHALGPGLMVYEVQETSDFTYRVFDWNRPQTSGRVLHIDKSLAVTRPDAGCEALPTPELKDGESRVLLESDYFVLEALNAQKKIIESNTFGQSFHALTVIEGVALFSCGREQIRLCCFESVLVPASAGAYRLEPVEGNFKALRASL